MLNTISREKTHYFNSEHTTFYKLQTLLKYYVSAILEQVLNPSVQPKVTKVHKACITETRETETCKPQTKTWTRNFCFSPRITEK